MRREAVPEIRNLDVVTLEHIADAEAKGEPTPPAFVATIVRLLKRGFIRSDRNRRVRVTSAGARYLKKSSA